MAPVGPSAWGLAGVVTDRQHSKGTAGVGTANNSGGCALTGPRHGRTTAPMFDPDGPYFGEAVLVLADGRVFRGRAFGARATAVGEVVFNTSLTGYQEIVTDPSYARQLVCLTVSEVGNVGANDEDVESDRAGAEGLVIRSLSPVVSNWRASASLSDFMARRGMPGIGEIDTRALTRHLREAGAMMGALTTEGVDVDRLLQLAKDAAPMEGRGLAHEVSTRETYEWKEGLWESGTPPEPDLHVVALDFGIKQNILRNFAEVGIRTTVMPSTADPEAVLASKPDGVFLSNGPGDPAALEDCVDRIRTLLAHPDCPPVFGICLGHQLMCLALGGETYKLKFGHHGGNHPVRNESTQAVEITAQNHGFAASLESLGEGAELTHLNLFDNTVAGLKLTDNNVMGVQYHPEASPGPHDSQHLFADFATALRKHKAAPSASAPAS
jgi:carbamoyl-phosphate synthase small subunit